MRICIVTHCFYPSKLRGGPTVSMNNMVKALSNAAELHVITIGWDSNGERYTNVPMGHTSIGNVDVNYLTQNTPKAFYDAIKEVAPDVIYISSLFSWEYSVSALVYGKMHHTHVILAPRGELMPSALSLKKERKKAFLRLLKVAGLINKVDIHATSEEEEQQILRYLPGAKVWYIRNLPTIVPKMREVSEKVPGVLRIVMVGRIHPIKNVDLALQILANVSGKVEVDIYGSEEVSEYVAICKSLAESLPNTVKVHFRGVVAHEDIPGVIAKYNILLSPTQSENFGQAIVESMLCGRPVVISNNTPWHGLMEKKAGFDLSLKNPYDFASAIQKFVDMDEMEYRQWCDGAEKYIRKEIQMDSVVAAYRKMILGKV